MPRNSDEAFDWDDDEASEVDLATILERLELAEEIFHPYPTLEDEDE